MTLLVIIALFLGIFCGQSGFNQGFIATLTENSDMILYLLMFSVGISVGGNQTVFKRLKQTDACIWLIPIGVILGSFLGGLICAVFNDLTLWENLAVTSGLGWHTLSGVLVTSFFSSEVGAIAFLTNLLREFFSFLFIPVLAKRLNGYAVISVAGSTSVDTTLPVIMRSTSEEMVVYAIVNGVICTTLVPALIRFCYTLSAFFQ